MMLIEKLCVTLQKEKSEYEIMEKEFKTLVQLRRSHRKFTNEEIDAEDLKLILRAALMAPT